MSNQTYTIVIEGLPYCLGNLKPTWYAGTLDDGLVEHPRVNQSIDLMGGVARFDDVEFEIVDHLTRWAPFFRPVQPTSWRVISPNPIEYNTTSVVFEDATGIAEKDILYAENDTWEVDSIAGAPTITVNRQQYSCLAAGWACRYQADITRDYVTEVSRTGPPTIMGRMMAIYIDGNLEYIGRIVDLKQQGRAWSVRTTSVLNVLTQAIDPPNVGIRLRYNWNYNTTRWSVTTKQALGGGWQLLPDTYTITPSSGRGGTVDQLVNDTAQGLYSSCNLSVAYGMRWQGNDLNPDPGEIVTTVLDHGASQAIGMEWKWLQQIGNVTRMLGLKKYGVIFGYTGTTDYLEVNDIHYVNGTYNLSGYVGRWIVCGDQLMRVYSVDTVNGRITFDYVKDIESGELFLHTSAGYDSENPIELRVASILSGDSIDSVVLDAVTGTGALGLGLPASLFSDAPGCPQGALYPIWWDWSKGGIDEDLRAFGMALTLRNGQFQWVQVFPPIEAASTHAIGQADLCGGEVPEIARGYEAPVASITYADALSAFTCGWTATTGPGRASLRTLKLSTQIGMALSSPAVWMRLQATRLAWLSVGVPTMTIKLLADILQVGQVITLASRYVSDGNYKTDTLPALVIARDPGAAEYQIALNLIPSAGAVWAFSIEISSAALAVITPVLQADLATFAAVVPVGTEVMITECDQTSVLWEGTIASYQATTVTLSDAPTIGAADIAILTCQIDSVTWGSLQNRQVYAADASGVIPDPAVAAKVLT